MLIRESPSHDVCVWIQVEYHGRGVTIFLTCTEPRMWPKKKYITPKRAVVNSYENIDDMESTRDLADETEVSLDSLIDYIGLGPFHVCVFLLTCGGYFAFCTEIMLYIFLSSKLTEQFGVSDLEYSVLPSSSNLCNIFGGWTVGAFSDHFGRKWPYAFFVALIFCFGLGSAFAPSFWVFLAVRAFVSFSIGGVITCLFPTLLEFLPTKNRGGTMTCVTLCGALGSCSAAGLAWWLLPTYPINGWRYLTIACAVPTFFICVIRIAFPFESPKFLLHANKQEQLRRVIRAMLWCHRKNFSRDFGVDLESVNIVRYVQCTHAENEHVLTEARRPSSCLTCAKGPLKVLELFKKHHRWKTIPLTVAAVCMSVAFWGTSLFITQYFTRVGIDPYFTTFVSFLAQLPGIALVAIITDWPKVGRLNTMRLYSFLGAVSLMVLAFGDNVVVRSVCSIFVYFSLPPLYAVVYTYVSEAYPTSVRASATSYVVLATCVPGTVSPFISGYLAGSSLVWLYPLIWSCVMAAMFVASLCLRYETAGRSTDPQ